MGVWSKLSAGVAFVGTSISASMPTSPLGKHLLFGAITSGTAVVAAPAVLGAVGFTSAGIAAGSWAAAWQGSAVAAGSWFALAQSFAAVGGATLTQGAATVAVGSCAGAVTSVLTWLPRQVWELRWKSETGSLNACA